MALQGDLESFALPDVLRLLAGTTKSGRLGVTGSSEAGEVWILDGDIVGGSVTTRPNAKTPAEVVYELLLFDEGSFLFDDGEQLVDGGERSSVDEALSDADHLKGEWADVTTVVPSLDHWVTIAQEIDGDEVTVSAEDWRLLAPVAAGASVRDVGAHLDVSDLDASKRVRSLVEAGLVDLGDTPEGATSSLGAPAADEDTGAEIAGSSSYDDFDPDDLFVETGHHDPQTFAAEHDLVTLSAEEGPVVLETSEDALLPEPLPGEGTAYSADLNENSSVDARIFDAVPAEPVVDLTDSEIPEFDDVATEAEAEVDHDAIAGSESAFATGWNTSRDEAEIGTSEEAFAAVGWDDTPLVDHLGGDDAAAGKAEGSDGDRSSLLKFLSSVKP
ncbi:MAG: DUF4388 domain-containing protein [Aquihabitans sp.]